jgi:mycofactocin system glycosyltransferase
VRYTPDPWLRRWAGRVVAGGSPWRLLRLSPPSWAVLERAYRPAGICPQGTKEQRIVETLVDRGLLHPRPAPRPGPHDVTVIVPAYGRPKALAQCLRGLTGLDVLVVDDATPEPSPLPAVAAAAGARYLRLPENRGPAGARNAGLAHITAVRPGRPRAPLAGSSTVDAATGSSRLVAFVDSDCQPEPGFLDRLVPFFDDPRVAVVAPRVVPAEGDRSLLSRFERASSALDMGRHPALVRPMARLGFVPSATLVVRRDVLGQHGFDESLRLGEDVDLVWRLADAGHHVRYEPGVVIRHDPRGTLREWAGRRFEYGTSAADLAARHPGRLTPVRVSPWNLATLGLLGLGRPVAAAATTTLATGLLHRRLRQQELGPAVAARVVGIGVVADAVAIGQALRREYWPLGALAVAAAPKSRLARLAVGLMAVPVVADWLSGTPTLDPVRYAGLRALADGAYGSGVLASSLSHRTLAPLRPALRRAR